MLRRIAAALALALPLTATGLRAQVVPSDVVDRIIAIVGDSAVLQSQVMEEIQRLQISDPEVPDANDPDYEGFFREVLDTWVDRLIVLQAAAQDSLIEPDEAVIDQQVAERIDGLALQFGGMPALQIALQGEGFTLGEYREFLRQDMRQLQIFQLFFQSHLRDARPVEVSEQDLLARFQEASAQLTQRPRLLTFRQVVVQPTPSDSAKAVARAEAEALLERVVAGEDFATLAQESSDDVGTAPVGGDLGWFRRGQMVEGFDEAAFGIPPGSVSRVVESVFGYHIIKVERARGRSEVQARHILKTPEVTPQDVERARALAVDVARRAQAGESMVALYDEYSDPVAPDSITVAFDALGDFPAAYGALANVSGGEVVGPLEYQGQSGRPGDIRFAVVKVLAVREAGAYTLEDLRPQIAAQIQQERQREQILEELRARTFIELRM
jgi:peptidyl-prolyl cis-trans isomerase SurA